MSDYTAEYHKLLNEGTVEEVKLRARRIAQQLKIAIAACKTAESLNLQPLFYSEDGEYHNIQEILEYTLSVVEDPSPDGYVAHSI